MGSCTVMSCGVSGARNKNTEREGQDSQMLGWARWLLYPGLSWMSRPDRGVVHGCGEGLKVLRQALSEQSQLDRERKKKG
jgi:hypothetical protein